MLSFNFLYFFISKFLYKVNGDWGSWTSWSSCSKDCKKTRSRKCNNPAPANGGKDCVGSSQNTSSCTGGSCPRDGNWGSWTSWSSCGKDCKRTRSRKCDNPTPANGGKDCEGLDQGTLSCTGGSCPRDGNWGSWTAWTSCGKDCKKTRSRKCDNPTPANGGKDCRGLDQGTYSCTGGSCPRDGNWGSWTSWSSCGKDCKKTRSRKCDSPTPANGGSNCPGSSKGELTCTGNYCLGNKFMV